MDNVGVGICISVGYWKLLENNLLQSRATFMRMATVQKKIVHG